jgi:hypothetical protein
MILMISAMFVVFGSIAIAAQDKYTLKSGKLSFADSGARKVCVPHHSRVERLHLHGIP